MDDKEFELEIPGDESEAAESVTSKSESVEQSPDVEAPSIAEQHIELDEDDVEQGGRNVAEDLFDKGYQPVILFGNAFSGKTSLLLSLFATIRTEAALDAGLTLAPPILNRNSRYGRYITAQAEAFWGQKTQDFIEGTASPKTLIDLPFFIPVTLSPRGKHEAHFAFMESNGEWYRADRESEKLFPAMRKQIEDFMAHYQGGITFIHLVPYTQKSVRSANYDGAGDSGEIREASLAIDGALQAYKRARPDKGNDKHLMLVTKWDAHLPEIDRVEVLTDPDIEDVEEFVAYRYSQALASYKGLNLREDQVALNSYCAGIMTEQGVLSLKYGSEMRSAVIDYPTRLWRWLYKNAQENAGLPAVDPFPALAPQSAIVRFVKSWLDRIF